ncbi:TetR family transcriptional regulator [Thermobifida halotolerans]|uniref:TetR family transcriptional regulator n=1 Tax=Thermobifida halotolerans TaxID=483545 RepID=A0A399G551_9ACTN|nr:TetR/AcrR family transcriptional regulator [Thermobifida halotolerans]UOE20026.1 TetR family transcriptional regulator [Thermobifida halotolerans]
MTADLSPQDVSFTKHALDTAGRLFSEHGPNSVSMYTIASAAGVDPADFRRVFPSKLDLIHQLVLDRTKTLVERETTATDTELSPVEQMRALIRRHIEFNCRCRTELELRRVLLPTLRAISPRRYRELSQLLRAYHDRVHRLIEQGCALGLFHPSDDSREPVSATTVLRTLESSLNWYEPDSKLPLEQLSDVYEDLVLHHLLGVARS